MNDSPPVRRQTAPITSAASAPKTIAAAKWTKPLVTPLLDQEADRVRADAEECGVAEAGHAAEAEDQVQAQRGDAEDHHPRQEGEVVRLVQRERERRHEREDDEEREHGLER